MRRIIDSAADLPAEGNLPVSISQKTSPKT